MSYENAKKSYAAIGVDTDAAIEKLKKAQIALHCWQGDDVRGFDTDPEKPLTGGIQTTGNYPGRAGTPEELMADIDEVLKLIPGKAKLNLHASYAIFDEENGADVDDRIRLYETIFDGNPIVKDIKDVEDFTGTRHGFICFMPEVLQFEDDNLADYNGNWSGLAQDIAGEIFDQELLGIHFCTADKRECGAQTGKE